MWFYNACARYVFCYGLLVYGSSTRTNFEIIEMAQRRIIRAHFFRRKFDSLQNILPETELSTVFDVFILDVFREIFIQLRLNETTKFSKYIVDSKHQKTQGSKKGLLRTGNSLQSNKKEIKISWTCPNQRLYLVAPNEFHTCWYRNHVSGTNQNLPKNITRLFITDSSDPFI